MMSVDPPLQSSKTWTIDPVLPFWSKVLIGFFTIASTAMGLAPAALALVIFDVVLRTQAGTLLPVLVAMAVCALVGQLIVSGLRSLVLIGQRAARERLIACVDAVLACILLAALALVHPLLPMGAIASSVVFSSLVFFVRRNHLRMDKKIFDREEVAAALTGRSPEGLAALQEDAFPILRLREPLFACAVSVSFVATVAIGGYLTGAFRLSEGGMIAAALLAATSSRALIGGFDHFLDWLRRPKVTPLEPVLSADQSDEPHFIPGLKVRDLTIQSCRDGVELLSAVDLDVGRGGMVGITGQGSGGKSLLLSCIQSPRPNASTKATGYVGLDGASLWNWRVAPALASVVFVPDDPLIISGTAGDNLTFFSKDQSREALKSKLLRVDVLGKHTDRILECPDATLLSRREGKILSLARAFSVEPKLYLLDSPERDLSERSFYALLELITAERELGRSFLVVTENKTLLEQCDEVLVLENGFVNDRGLSRDVLERQSSGRHRIVVSRQLSSEERLHGWARSLYTRKGDEENRHRACELLTELLALSCETAPPNPGYVTFDLKHQVGYSTLKMYDLSPRIGSAVLEDMRSREEEPKLGTRFRPLWQILKTCLDLSQEHSKEDGKSRVTTVTFEIYDPRKSKEQNRITHSSLSTATRADKQEEGVQNG